MHCYYIFDRIETEKELLAAITAIKPQSVVVTHGTDTIIETARWLSGKLPAKIIVLTGAIPHAIDGWSVRILSASRRFCARRPHMEMPAGVSVYSRPAGNPVCSPGVAFSIAVASAPGLG